LKFLPAIRPNDQNDFIDLCAPFEPVHRSGDDRLIAYEAQQLVEPHSPAAPGGHNNRANHY
jgi:hypothetical protein